MMKDIHKYRTESWSRIKANSLGGLGKHLMSQLNIYVFISSHALFPWNRERVLHDIPVNLQPKSLCWGNNPYWEIKELCQEEEINLLSPLPTSLHLLFPLSSDHVFVWVKHSKVAIEIRSSFSETGKGHLSIEVLTHRQHTGSKLCWACSYLFGI